MALTKYYGIYNWNNQCIVSGLWRDYDEALKRFYGDKDIFRGDHLPGALGDKYQPITYYFDEDGNLVKTWCKTRNGKYAPNITGLGEYFEAEYDEWQERLAANA